MTAVRLAERVAVEQDRGEFGMYPVGFYDLRDDAPPVPVVSTAFRPTDADELGRNPFRVFTSMLATDDNRFFGVDLRVRQQPLTERELFDPALIAEARRIAADGGITPGRAERFVDAAVAAFTLRGEPIEKLGTTNWRECRRWPPISPGCGPPTSTT